MRKANIDCFSDETERSVFINRLRLVGRYPHRRLVITDLGSDVNLRLSVLAVGEVHGLASRKRSLIPRTDEITCGAQVVQCQLSTTTAVISASMKVKVTIGPSRTLSTKGGRKQAMQAPSFCRTLGYTIPAEPLVSSLSPSAWEAE